MISLKKLISEQEEDIKGVEFTDFAGKRYDGAKKISDTAKKKGGPAILTYHHFVVKLPYYEKAREGGFNPLEAQRQLKEKLQDVCLLSGQINMGQIEFQEKVGEVEVLGELLIKWNEITKPYIKPQ